MKLVRFVVLIAHLVIVALLASTILNAYFAPRDFPLLNFLSLGFPFLMIVNVFLILFWIVLFKKRALVFIVITIFFLTPIRRWINYSSKNEGSASFKMVTYNIKGSSFKENSLTEIQDLVNSANADVVFIQEIGYEDKRPSFKNLTGDEHPQVVSFYTKHKVVKTGSLDFTENAEGRFADIEINGKIIRFINVYLEPFQLKKEMVKPTSSIDANEEKAKSLIRRFIPVFKLHQDEVNTMKDFIQQSPYPVIVGGDFNSVPNSYEYYTINSVLKDAFLEAGSGSATSFHDYKFPIRIDYLFTSKEIKCKSYKVNRTKDASDHYPVFAEFSFN